MKPPEPTATCPIASRQPSRGWRHHVRRVVDAISPFTDAAEKVMALAVHVERGITPAGAVGLTSAAINALRPYLSSPATSSREVYVLASRAQRENALLADGWSVTHADGDATTMQRDGQYVHVRARAVVVFDDAIVPDVLAAMDKAIPHRIRIAKQLDEWPEASPADMTHFETSDAARIAEHLRLHLAHGPRCILLDGEPGVGKTSIAREIIDRLGVRRAAFFDTSVFRHDTFMRQHIEGYPIDAAVIDDVHTMPRWPMEDIESLRAHCRLVILTANRTDDAVLDAAAIRPGRIDEIYTIESAPRAPGPPFDLLTLAEWAEVRMWPAAYLCELAGRLDLRGRDDARIDEMRARIGRRVHAGGDE